MEHVTFNSLGTRCAGDLYLPPTREPVPGLVLGHSGVMVKEALAVFAPYFVRAGFAVLDRRISCVVVQSPSVWNGWRYLERLMGRAGVHALRDELRQDWQRRYEGGQSARVPHLTLDHDSVKDAPDMSTRLFPTYRNEKTLDSVEHLLTFAPANLIHRLAPTPLLMIANGGWDPYHILEEAQSAFDRAGEPKRLEVLPYDVLGLYTGPGLDEAMTLAVDWFDLHLRRTPLAAVTPVPAYETVAAMTQ
ncbi:hypothetical protein ACFFV7_45285 [Nonomuraea spiralis]|uniref:Alpha/beta hydrolase n=1 Tax=Nonomuraea spiralis TaxID=46182 RepID=A0ABV5IW21_9ACTN|nr:alpha/beta hydrolase [Nonomuraea spiralis]GGS82699.1 hypothetical protein GCM10010176_027750 [Nonomuraea spiralis]